MNNFQHRHTSGFCTTSRLLSALFALAILLLSCLSASTAAAVSLSVAANRDSVAWGDPVIYRVRLQRAATDEVEIVPGAFPGPFEIRQVLEPVVTKTEDGRVQEIRDFTLKAFEPGVLEIPSVTARTRTAQGDTSSISSRSVTVTVVDLDTGEGFAEYAGPQKSIPLQIPWWLWASAVLLAAALILAILKWRRRGAAIVAEENVRPVDWREEVGKIKAMQLLSRGEFKRHYSLLSEALRRFTESVLDVRAVERTTGELRGDLATAEVDPSAARALTAFLSEADLVKFAKMVPGSEQAESSADRALELMDRLEPDLPDDGESAGGTAPSAAVLAGHPGGGRA